MKIEYKFPILAGVVLLAVSNIASAADMLSLSEKADIIMSCERAEHDYAIYRDRHDAEAFANIFTEEGEWGRSNGRVLKGREAIAEYVRGLEAATTEPEYNMQFTTTTQITPTSATTATGISYALILEAPVPEDGGRALIPGGSFTIGSESRSTFEMTDEGCKIASREYTTYFHAP